MMTARRLMFIDSKVMPVAAGLPRSTGSHAGKR